MSKKRHKPKAGKKKQAILADQKVKQLGIVLGILTLFFILAVSTIILVVRSHGKALIAEQEQIPQATVAMILGASVTEDGQPGDLLQDRLDKGIELYNSNKISRLLITGDDGLNRANEIYVMYKYLLDNNIPREKIIIDKHGYRTYESCRRANEIYGVKDALIVTQKFHLPRALYLCDNFTIQSTGVPADMNEYDGMLYNYTRDWLASFKAWVDINLLEPEPPVYYYETNQQTRLDRLDRL